MEWTLLETSLKQIWPMLTIFLAALISIRVTSILVNHEKFIFYKEFLNLAFVIYMLLLYHLLTNTEWNSTGGFNIVPFTEIFRYEWNSSGFYWNVLGNIALFIPFGYFVSGYVKASKVSHILWVSLFTSMAVEFVQYFIGRSFDIDDILLNVIGAIIGFLLSIGFAAIRRHLPRFFRSDTFYNILCFLIILVAVLYVLKVMGVSLI